MLFSDSDHAGDSNMRVSMTEFYIFLLGVPIMCGMSESQLMSEAAWSIDIILAMTTKCIKTVTNSGILGMEDPKHEQNW